MQCDLRRAPATGTSASGRTAGPSWPCGPRLRRRPAPGAAVRAVVAARPGPRARPGPGAPAHPARLDRGRARPAKVRLLRTYDPGTAELTAAAAPGRRHRPPLDVPDPYYSDLDAFELVLDQVERACAGPAGPPARPPHAASPRRPSGEQRHAELSPSARTTRLGAGRERGGQVFVKRRVRRPGRVLRRGGRGLRWLAAVPGGGRVVGPLEVGRRPPRPAPAARGGPHRGRGGGAGPRARRDPRGGRRRAGRRPGRLDRRRLHRPAVAPAADRAGVGALVRRAPAAAVPALGPRRGRGRRAAGRPRCPGCSTGSWPTPGSPARRTGGPGPAARRPVERQRACGPPTGWSSSTPPRTAGTARPTWPCSRCSGCRTWAACSPPTTRRAPSPTAGRTGSALHQLHPLLVHAALFGGGYGAQAAEAASRYV